MLDQTNEALVDEVLNSPSVWPYLKAEILYRIGRAFVGLGKSDEGLRYFQRVMDEYPNEGDKSALSAILRATLVDELYPDSPDQTLLAFQEVINRYPQSKYAPAAMFFMASIYNRFDNFDYAVNLLNRIATEYPKAPVAPRANDTVQTVLTELWDGTPIARAGIPAPTLASLCGPTALKHMLAMNGISTSTEELALLAGTNERGTSMLALARASAAKGLVLMGVKTASLSELQAPFVAFVDTNHFVLVERIEGDEIVVRDMENIPSKVKSSDFFDRWNGEALVRGDRSFLATTLNDEQLSSTVGGVGDINFDCGIALALGIPCNSGTEGGGTIGDLLPECGGAAPDGNVGDDSGCGEEGGDTGTSPDGQDCNDPNGGSYNPGAPRASGSVGNGASYVSRGRYAPLGTGADGLGRAGIHANVDPVRSGVRLDETDLSIKSVGQLHLHFTRNFENTDGLKRTYFSNDDLPLRRNIGVNWTHNLNYHIVTGTKNPPSSIGVVSGDGGSMVFSSSGSDATYNYFKNGLTYIKRHKTNRTYTAEFPNGYVYQFPAHTNGVSRLDSITEPGGNSLTFQYNGSGYLTKVSTPATPDGRYLLLEYGSNSQITKASIKDSSNNVLKYVSYAYDSNKWLTKVTHDGETTGIQYAYTAPSSPAGALYVNKITDRMSKEYLFTFDYDTTLSKATKVIVDYPKGLRTVFNRGGLTDSVFIRHWKEAAQTTQMMKRLWKAATPDLNRITEKQFFANPADTTPVATYVFAYDSSKRLTTVKLPGGSSAYYTYQYDSDGRVVTVIKGTSTTNDPTWNYSYGSSGIGASMSPTQVVAPDGTVTDIYWYSSELLSKVIAPQHGATSGIQYFYNSSGQLTTITDALAKNWVFEYDGMGNVTKAKNPLLQVTEFLYDKLNRVTKVKDSLLKETIIEYSSGGGCSGCGLMGNVTKVRRAFGSGPIQYRDTQFQYNANNRVTKTIDPASHTLDLFYDDQNRLTKTTYPSGVSGKSTTVAYDEMSRVTGVTDAKSNVATFAYDYQNRMTSVTDPVDSTVLAYDAFGTVTTVTDGNSHTWTSYVDTYNRVTKVTDPSPPSKSTKYFYDKSSRVTKVGANSSGTTYPISYTYSTGSSGTGMLTRVDYNGASGSGTAGYAVYTYDAMGKLSTLDDDWKDFVSVPPLEYKYDDAGRLTKLYDGTYDFLYNYNAAGAVTTVTDWGDRVTRYAYNDLHELTALDYLDGTANEKNWSFAYNSVGQPDSVTAPNGLVTDYVYDGNGVMTDILHKSGSTVKQGYSYLYDDVYNITKITHEDSSYWTYTYDNRYRLSTAVRHNSGDTIQANYAYTYDDGDNLVTKVEPWVDDFADGTVTDDGLSVSGTWSVVNGAAQNTSNALGASLYRTVNDDDLEFRYAYTIDSTTSGTPYAQATFRFNTTSTEKMYVRFYSDHASLYYYNGTSATEYQNTGVTTATGTKYTVRIEASGANVKVWRATGGGLETQVFSRTDAPLYNGDRFSLIASPNTVVSFDDLMILADDSGLNRSTTFTVANNNELSTMATTPDTGGSTSYTYDDWGRLTTETRGSVTKTYGWTKANLLASVDSSDSADTDVSYAYTGDLKRIFRFENSSLRNTYSYGAGFDVVAEGAWSGGAPIGQKTYADGLAEVDVTGTPAYSYLTHDHLGSTRGMWDGGINQTGSWEFTPYGAPYHFAGPSGVTQLYTGHDLDKVTGNYFAPFRTLNPNTGRWASRDPLGMIDGTNMYGYVGGSPTMFSDPMGLLPWYDDVINSAANVAAGFGDKLTSGFGLTDLVGLPSLTEAVRDGFGVDDFVNQCSTSYISGEVLGDLWGLAGAGGARAAQKGITVTFNWYPKARGIGINVLKKGERLFGLDWHKFKLGGKWTNRLHYHLGKTKSQMKKHRPWQGG